MGEKKNTVPESQSDTAQDACEMNIVFSDAPEDITLRKIKRLVQKNGGEFMICTRSNNGCKKTYSKGYYAQGKHQGSNPASILYVEETSM